MNTKRLLPLLMICLLALAPAAHAALAPDASVLADALRGTPYEGYALSCQTFAMQYGEPGNSSAYAIATGGGKAVLCAFEENEGDWHLRIANANALPDGATQLAITIQDDIPLVTIDAETPSGSMQLQFVVNGSANYPYDWPLFAVTLTTHGANGATSTTRVAPNEETGRWTVTENDELKYYENDAYTRMADLDLHDFPLTRAAADAVWHDSGTTVFIEPDDTLASSALRILAGQQVVLQGTDTVPVYSGPGDVYVRGADGKAAVSPKEPITVYATDYDWVLISYRVANGERFGYIPRGYLPADITISHELWQDTMSMGLTTGEVAVLDNLSEPDKPLYTLPYQTPLEVLATLGDWLYVHAGTSDTVSAPFRGFIPISSFHHTNRF